MADAIIKAPRKSLVATMAAKYSIEPEKFLEAIKATCIEGNASDAQLMAFLAVANRYNLDPLRKEIYAFPKPGGGIQPIVGIDGWARIANENPQYDGVEFIDVLENGKVVAIKGRIYRKDRSHPTEVTEYLSECKRNTPAWNITPGRMLRHRTFIQGVRIGLSVSGLMDPDEAAHWIEVEAKVAQPDKPKTIEDLKRAEAGPKPVAQIIEALPAERRVQVESRGKELVAEESARAEPPSLFVCAPSDGIDLAVSLALDINQLAPRLGVKMFGALLKKHAADSGARNYGLGIDGLRGLLDDAVAAVNTKEKP